MARLPAEIATIPASPEANVSELIRPPLTIDARPSTATRTEPALPDDPGPALLAIPVVGKPFPSMLKVPAETAIVPALPDPKVSELIFPPPTIEACPTTVTCTEPAFPEPPMESVAIPVTRSPCPSIVKLPAETATVPALPGPKVREAICPPLTIAACPPTVTSIAPAFPGDVLE
jgi:hypothetical protein